MTEPAAQVRHFQVPRVVERRELDEQPRQPAPPDRPSQRELVEASLLARPESAERAGQPARRI